MLLRTAHTTCYGYQRPVSVCHTEVHLTPRMRVNQTVLEYELAANPAPDFSSSHEDYFGNEVTVFAIEEPHRELTITARSLVSLTPRAPLEMEISPPWEEVREQVRRGVTPQTFEAGQFVFESPLIQLDRGFASYASASFPAGRRLLEGVDDLSRRIFTEFRYDPRATTVTTPVAEVLASRRGVCQDFAQLMIACLRSLDLPARYVSGYVRSDGSLVGAAASHAWVSVYCPEFGWQDFDPTNNLQPEEHITLAWGRDYSDVTPVKGVALGGGEQDVTVVVEVSEQVTP
jgi:transglutaminase-like putative cysteine protease